MSFARSDIPNLSGKIAIVTGTGGLGYEDALALAAAGATTIVAGRSAKKGAEAVKRIKAEYPKADISFGQVDLADLKSVARFATEFAASHDKLDILINNAGVMALPERQTTADGFEMQLGTNYLGHFALTAQLLPLLSKARGRVVTLSSIMARRGKLHFDNLQFTTGYTPNTVYAQSKLACLMFARELQARSDANGWGISSYGAHPGISSTDLIENGMGRNSLASRLKPITGLFFQSPAAGALSTLYAATSADAEPGAYYGPNGFMEVRGAVTDARVPPLATNKANSARLWTMSEQLVGIAFPSIAKAA